jgi:hypothetical protein
VTRVTDKYAGFLHRLELCVLVSWVTWIRRQLAPPKHLYLYMNIQGAISHMTGIFVSMSVRNSALDKKVVDRYPIPHFSTVKVFHVRYSSSPSSMSECPLVAVSAPRIWNSIWTRFCRLSKGFQRGVGNRFRLYDRYIRIVITCIASKMDTYVSWFKGPVIWLMPWRGLTCQ